MPQSSSLVGLRRSYLDVGGLEAGLSSHTTGTQHDERCPIGRVPGSAYSSRATLLPCLRAFLGGHLPWSAAAAEACLHVASCPAITSSACAGLGWQQGQAGLPAALARGAGLPRPGSAQYPAHLRHWGHTCCAVPRSASIQPIPDNLGTLPLSLCFQTHGSSPLDVLGPRSIHDMSSALACGIAAGVPNRDGHEDPGGSVGAAWPAELDGALLSSMLRGVTWGQALGGCI